MFSYITSWLPGFLIPEWDPLSSLLQGVLSACGICILCNVMRVHMFLTSHREEKGASKRSFEGSRSVLGQSLQFFCLTALLSVVGSRVAALVLLEFSLRVVSAWVTTRPDSTTGGTLQLLLQCQFSLGCGLSCTVHFLQEGAPQRLLSLLLAAGLSWLLFDQSRRLWLHVSVLYPLHSSQRYCGVCICLLSSGHALLPLLCRVVKVAFAVSAYAAICTFNSHFLTATEALRFWTPLTLCYALLVVYIQDENQRRPAGEAVVQTVTVRLGGLLFLLLLLGRWADVLHALLCFLGEALCLLPSRDMQDVVTQELAEQMSGRQAARGDRGHLRKRDQD